MATVHMENRPNIQSTKLEAHASPNRPPPIPPPEPRKQSAAFCRDFVSNHQRTAEKSKAERDVKNAALAPSPLSAEAIVVGTGNGSASQASVGNGTEEVKRDLVYSPSSMLSIHTGDEFHQNASSSGTSVQTLGTVVGEQSTHKATDSIELQPNQQQTLPLFSKAEQKVDDRNLLQITQTQVNLMSNSMHPPVFSERVKESKATAATKTHPIAIPDITAQGTAHETEHDGDDDDADVSFSLEEDSLNFESPEKLAKAAAGAAPQDASPDFRTMNTLLPELLVQAAPPDTNVSKLSQIVAGGKTHSHVTPPRTAAYLAAMSIDEAFKNLTPLAVSLLEESLQAEIALHEEEEQGLPSPALFGDRELTNAVRLINDERRDGYVRYGNTIVPVAAVERFEHSDMALSLQMDEWMSARAAGGAVSALGGGGGGCSPSTRSSKQSKQASPTYSMAKAGGASFGALPSPSLRYARMVGATPLHPSSDDNALSVVGAVYRSELATFGATPTAGDLTFSAAAKQSIHQQQSASPLARGHENGTTCSPSIRNNSFFSASPFVVGSCKRGILAARRLSGSLTAAGHQNGVGGLMSPPLAPAQGVIDTHISLSPAQPSSTLTGVRKEERSSPAPRGLPLGKRASSCSVPETVIVPPLTTTANAGGGTGQESHQEDANKKTEQHQSDLHNTGDVRRLTAAHTAAVLQEHMRGPSRADEDRGGEGGSTVPPSLEHLKVFVPSLMAPHSSNSKQREERADGSLGVCASHRMQSATMRPGDARQEDFSECFPPSPAKAQAGRGGRATRHASFAAGGSRERGSSPNPPQIIVEDSTSLYEQMLPELAVASSPTNPLRCTASGSRSNGVASAPTGGYQCGAVMVGVKGILRREAEVAANNNNSVSGLAAHHQPQPNPHTTYTIFQGKKMTIAERDARVLMEEERISRLKRRAAEYLNYAHHHRQPTPTQGKATAGGAPILPKIAPLTQIVTDKDGSNARLSTEREGSRDEDPPSKQPLGKDRVAALAPRKPAHLAPITHRPRPLSAN